MVATMQQPQFKSDALTRLRRADERIQNTLRGFREAVDAANKRPRVFSDPRNAEAVLREHQTAWQAEVAEAHRATLAKLAALRDDLEEDITYARDDVRRALSRPSTADGNERLRRSLEENRAWQRIRPILDRVDALQAERDAQQMLTKALKEGAEDDVWALRAELPSYLAGRGSALSADDALMLIDQTIGQHRPAVAAALAARAELTKGAVMVETALDHVTHDFEQGKTRYTLPSWSGAGAYSIDLADAPAADLTHQSRHT